MEQKEQQTAKRAGRTGGRILIAILLLIILGMGTALWMLWTRHQQYKEDAIAAMAKTETEHQAELDRMIPVELFQEYVQQYNVSTEFIQRFFDDAIVYKGEEGVVFAPIDDSLPKSDYQRSNFVRQNGIIDYVVDGESQALMGIDVSKYQGDIDWEAVKAAGVEYAMIRVGYRGYGTGKIVLDETFEENIEGALAADIPVGVYFYSQAVNPAEAIEEANQVLESIGDYEVTWPIVFDMEEVVGDEVRTAGLTSEQITEITLAFCDTIEEAGYHPVIYGNVKWFMSKLELSKVASYDKWLAQYYRAPFFPYAYQMWQYTGSGSLDGITGDVDLNLSFVDYGAGERE